MATNAQSGNEPQLDKDGPPLPTQVYSVESAGFAAPQGTGYATDGTPTGYLLQEHSAPRVSMLDAQVANLLVSGASPGTINIAAPGAGKVNVFLGIHIGINNTAAELINVTFPAGWLGGTVFRAASTTTQVGELDWSPVAGIPQAAANTAAAISVTWSPTPAVANPDVSIFYSVRTAN